MMKQYYIVITPFFPNSGSFRGAFIYDQVRAIAKNSNYEVVVFKSKSITSGEKDYVYRGFQVHLFDDIQMPSYILNGLTNGINCRLFMQAVKRLNIDVNNIAIAHGHTARFAAFPLVLKHINHNIKALVQHHDLDPFNIRNGCFATKRWNAVFRTRMSTKLFNQMDCHVCVRRFVEESLRKIPHPTDSLYFDSYKRALQVVENEKSAKIKYSYVLYNGVDCSIFYSESRFIHHTFTIGCIANFVDLKSQETLIRALDILKSNQDNLKMIFVGSGPTLQDCINLVQELNLTDIVEFRREVHHHELAAFYHSLDLFVLPSYFEGFGCVCTEAAACGVPYMICKGQGAAEYILKEESDLWTFTPKDYKQLANRIDYYITHRPKQHLCKPFDIDILIKHFLTHIKTL
ncbi:MAG: glycosyltransferase family 4 protein [Bacteroides sp.]|nr:glycosyltransferase family 4 protein [Bacteroides sp.]